MLQSLRLARTRFVTTCGCFRLGVFDADGQMGSEELRQRMRLLDNEIRIMRSDTDRIRHESTTQVSKYNDVFSANLRDLFDIRTRRSIYRRLKTGRWVCHMTVLVH